MSTQRRPSEIPVNMKTVVQPVCPMLVHKSSYEGPCKTSPISPEEERKEQIKICERFVKAVKKNLTEEAVMLKPVSLEYNENYKISKSQWKKIEDDLQEADIILLSGYCRAYGFERYKKPVAMIGHGVGNVDIAAYLRNNGIEGYAPYDWDEMNDLISLMRIRKDIERTKILVVTDRPGGLPSYGVKSIIPGDTLKKRFGINCKYVSFKEFFDEMDRISRSRSENKEADEITENLIRKADRVDISKNFVKNDVNFYLTAKRLMEKYRCNGFTIDCFEVCSSKIPNERKFVPCLTHSLLKDEGYPSACENDLNAFLSTALEIYMSGKSVFMGNPVFDKETNIVHISHAEPGLKMKGFSNADLPYGLGHFIEGGWGTAIRYNFGVDRGEVVTLARFNPSSTNILITRGEIVGGSSGMGKLGCSSSVSIKIPNALEFFHQQANTGHHLSLVYGDYTRQIKKLSDMMKFQVIDV
jgi:hypothetical protein